MKKSVKPLMALLTVMLLLTLSSATVFAVESPPPSVPNPFGDPVEDEEPPSPELADTETTTTTTTTTTTPTPTPRPGENTTTAENTQTHQSANELTKSGQKHIIYYFYWHSH
jgi:hypothetical protein